MFKKIKQNIKCTNCLVFKKDKREEYTENNIIHKKGDCDILFVLDMMEYPNYVNKLTLWLDKLQFNNYWIVSPLNCRISDFKSLSPIYECYKHCNLINETNFSPKVIITSGRGLYSITKNDDIIGYKEFCEILFNQTYFYTGVDWKSKIRVYPIPLLSEIINKDNFENYFTIHQFKKVSEFIKNYKKEEREEIEYKEVTDLNSFLEEHMQERIVAWDLETTSLHHFDDDFKVFCCSMSFDGKIGYYFPFENIDKRALSNFFKDKYQLLSNGKFDIKALQLLRIFNVKQDEDVSLLYHILNTSRTTNSIKSLSWILGYGGYEREVDDYKSKYKISNYSEIPKDIIKKYAIMDSIVTYRLYENAKNNLIPKQQKIYNIYKDTILPVIPVFQEMEIEGMEIDKEYLNEYDAKLSTEISKMEVEIRKELGGIQLTSNQQLAKALEEKGFPSLGRSDSQFYFLDGVKLGYFKVGDSQFREWKNLGFDLADKILNFKELQKRKSAYVGEIKEEVKKEFSFFESKEKDEKEEGIVKFIRSDGLIHPVYSPGRSDALRSSCITDDCNILSSTGKVTLKEIIIKLKKKEKIFVKTHMGNFKQVLFFWKKGKREVYEIILENGLKIKCTKDHKFLTENGWKELKDLNINKDKILSIKNDY